MLAVGFPGSAELFFIFLIFGLPFFIILGALIDILRIDFEVPQNKLVWVLVTLLLPVIGAVLYFAIGRSQRKVSQT